MLVLVGPRVAADVRLLEEMAAGELAALGVGGRFRVAADAAAFRHELDAADGDAAIVALPGPDPDLRRLIATPPACAPRVVWLDITRVGPVKAAGGAAHVQGRGVWGLAWAVRHAVHRLRTPARRIPYGEHADQWAELRLPSTVADGTPPSSVEPRSRSSAADPTPPPSLEPRSSAAADQAPPPVAVLLHGGYWRSIWGADLMDAIAIDLARRGYAAWNLEYRRPDLHGWDATTHDVAAGLAALREAAAGVPLDLTRIAVLGHSAGGQLALRLAADTARQAADTARQATGTGPASRPQAGLAQAAAGAPATPDGPSKTPGGGPVVTVAVSLAGVLDLTEADRRHMSTGAVAAALGGTADDLPEAYAASSPMERLPLGVPQLVVQGGGDDPDLVDMARRYAAAAGEEASLIEGPGDHFAVIDPASPLWTATMTELARRLGRP
ncbi:hypothetical protein Sme01_49870 [Sphaerisporangium melleum]|uniref:BD-FAE-like domain-containing protein n=1 Tax=Sphaerisporangium melleum TaxID=321316 RepID=A0A917VK31_9ACTN|nr:alpha/beta hydrolase [Sphaerisporangium melleum]GGK89536.1 hypothetical protein GCM10007964_35280 [Sphaerisporangium melleum]GII72511.1 hypothetical protein Sme01_49870 [Sphaerisporangium melleum]